MGLHYVYGVWKVSSSAHSSRCTRFQLPMKLRRAFQNPDLYSICDVSIVVIRRLKAYWISLLTLTLSYMLIKKIIKRIKMYRIENLLQKKTDVPAEAIYRRIHKFFIGQRPLRCSRVHMLKALPAMGWKWGGSGRLSRSRSGNLQKCPSTCSGECKTQRESLHNKLSAFSGTPNASANIVFVRVGSSESRFDRRFLSIVIDSWFR